MLNIEDDILDDEKRRGKTNFAKYSDSEQSSDSSFSHLTKPSRLLGLTPKEATELIQTLREEVNYDEMNLHQKHHAENIQTQIQEVEQFLVEMKKENAAEEEEAENSDIDQVPTEKKDAKRISHLEKTRPRWLTCCLKLLFHILVFINFFASWTDSVTLLMEDAKLNLWLLEDDYNCLDLVPNADMIDHTVNIVHALLSCSVLFVQNRNSARLCLAWMSSQAAHTVYRTMQFCCSLKFEIAGVGNLEGIPFLVGNIIFNGFGSLLLLHKYYDLTDQFRTRLRVFGSAHTGERSLNDGIIYRNETGFLQRKAIVREVTITQTYAIIQKIEKHAQQGLHMDPLTLYREINAAKMALQDCADAANHNMPTMLKKAYAKRLKEMETKQQDVIGIEKKINSHENHSIIHDISEFF